MREDGGRISVITRYQKTPKLVFLSHGTTPTENEAREALCRILRSRDRRPSLHLLELLADVLEPTGRPHGIRRHLKVEFKKRNKGHSDIYRDMAIADFVYKLRREGKSREEAIDKVSDAIGLGVDQVRKIYARDYGKVRFPRRRRGKG
jgi:hypothetical protein